MGFLSPHLLPAISRALRHGQTDHSNHLRGLLAILQRNLSSNPPMEAGSQHENHAQRQIAFGIHTTAIRLIHMAAACLLVWNKMPLPAAWGMILTGHRLAKTGRLAVVVSLGMGSRRISWSRSCPKKKGYSCSSITTTRFIARGGAAKLSVDTAISCGCLTAYTSGIHSGDCHYYHPRGLVVRSSLLTRLRS